MFDRYYPSLIFLNSKKVFCFNPERAPKAYARPGFDIIKPASNWLLLVGTAPPPGLILGDPPGLILPETGETLGDGTFSFF